MHLPRITFTELNVISGPMTSTRRQDRHAALFRALGHPARIRILEQLRDGEQCVCHLEAQLNLPQSYISQHLGVLRDAGMVAVRRDGWNVFYRIRRRESQGMITVLKDLLSEGQQRPSGSTAPDCRCPKCQARSSPGPRRRRFG